MKLLLITLVLFSMSVKGYAQSFEDCSFYYSISTEDNKCVKVQPETYRIYYNNMNINPYLNRDTDGNKPDVKGDTYTLYEKNNCLFMTRKTGAEISTLKIASLKLGDTVEIDEEYDNPMMLFAFGERSVMTQIANVEVFGQAAEIYIIKFIQDEDNYTYLYLHKKYLLPLKYEIIVANTKKNIIRNKITVVIEKGNGQNVSGSAAFTLMNPVCEGDPLMPRQ